MNKTTEVFESENSNYSSTSVERALKLAEEALKKTISGCEAMGWTTIEQEKALAAIREARAEQEKQEPVSMFEWQNGNPVGVRKAAPVQQAEQEPVAWRSDDANDGMRYSEECDLTGGETDYAAPVSAKPCKECDAKQAKIDSLMLEYCPDEITDEQMTEWSANQKPVSECRHCGWLCMPNDSHSKKWYPMQEPVNQEPVAVVDEIGKRLDGTYIFNAVGKVDVGQPLYAAPVDAKAIRAETLEEAAKLCEQGTGDAIQTETLKLLLQERGRIASVIRELK